MAAKASFVVDNFLGGEWSPLAQGRISDPLYKRAMNVCRNSLPIEEGSWTRRPGVRTLGTTLNGFGGRVIHFDFESSSPYIMEFTDGALRMFGVGTQTVGLISGLQSDFRLVTTNDNQQVASISTANPAVVQTNAAHGWATGDQVQFLFVVSLNAGFVPLLRNRVFIITVVDSTHFSIADPVTGFPVNGSTLGWSAQTLGSVVVARALQIATPYTSGAWASLRKVQAEQEAILLHGSFPPQNLQVTALPSNGVFASFALNPVSFQDGPYLDPPIDGTTLTPALTSPSSGNLPVQQAWNLMAAKGSTFLAASTSSLTAATSTDGVTWVSRTLPFQPQALAANGSIFVIAANNFQVATSSDGISWTTGSFPAPSIVTFGGIAWNGSVFCMAALSTSLNARSLTSPDGLTWTNHALPLFVQNNGSIAAAGSTFAVVGNKTSGGTTVATSTDGISWTTTVLPTTSGPGGYMASQGTTGFCLVFPNSSTTFFSTNTGSTWTQSTLPSSSNWDAIASNGSLFCALASGLGSCATSPTGQVWTTHALPSTQAWDAIAWNGTTFSIAASGYITTYASTNGVFSVLTLTASAVSSINNGTGFQATDVGRLVRVLSEPLPWFAATTYSAGAAVKFNGAYYQALQGTNTGHQPDTSPTFWALSTALAAWTWGTILSVTSTVQVVISVNGKDLLYPTLFISTWRLGVYSNTTGWPTCGLYYQGRLVLSGAIPNRIDMSVSNGISGNNVNMAPTAPDGTVADDNAISYIFNSTDVNQVFWLASTNDGIVAGTQAGEWLIVAPTAGPITPTNIYASRGTTYGSSNIEPEYTQLTLCFVQRFNRTLLEYFPDVFSRRFTAPNLTENAKHLTVTGIQEIRYQQELIPTIWGRMGDGSLKGVTYERDNLFSSQPARFIGWHRHDLGGNNLVESIAVGPSEDGTLDAPVFVINNGSQVRHVGVMRRMFDVEDSLLNAGFLDDSITPSGGVITGTAPNSTLTLNGLWHLNGNTVSVWVGGVDVGDFLVTNGSVAVPIDNDPVGLFTTAYLATISAPGVYGILACPIDQGATRYTVPAVVGYTYTSQGQLVRPDQQEQNRSPTGPGLAKPRRAAQFGAFMVNTQGISFGTDFSKMHTAILKTPGGSKQLTLLQLFTGVHWATVDDTWGFGSQLCWEIDRPYPASLASITGFLEMQDR